MMRRGILGFGLWWLCAGAAQAHDWYGQGADKTSCQDVTAAAAAAGDAALGTPDGMQALYQSLGEVVVTKQVVDASGAPIFVIHITDSEGSPILDFTFYPALADCQFVLNYEAAH